MTQLVAVPRSGDVAALMALVDKVDSARDDNPHLSERVGTHGLLLDDVSRHLPDLLRACWLDVPVADALPILARLYPSLLQLFADAVESDCTEPVARFPHVKYTKEAWGAMSYEPLTLLAALIEVTCSATWTPKAAAPASSASAAPAASSASATASTAVPSADRQRRAQVGWLALWPHVSEVLQLVTAFFTSKSPQRVGPMNRTPGFHAVEAARKMLVNLFRLPAMKQWLREEASVKDSLPAKTVQSFAMQLLVWMEDEPLVHEDSLAEYECQQAYLSRGLPLPPRWPGGPPTDVKRDPRIPDPRFAYTAGFGVGPQLLDTLLWASTSVGVHTDALSTLVWTHCSRTLQRAAAASSSSADAQPAVSDLELRASIRGIESLLTYRPLSVSASDVDVVGQCLTRLFSGARVTATMPLPLSTPQATRLGQRIAQHRAKFQPQRRA